MTKRKSTKKAQVKAVSYLRTSSAANVGADKDSDARQRSAVAAYAEANGFEIVGEFYDAAVSGADAIETRPGFAALLDQIEGSGVSTVIVEDASRFARQVLVQELGIMALQERGVRVLTASGDDLTETDDPSKVMMRQVAAAFAQFEKARLVSKLAAARKRKKEETGRCEGRKPLSMTHPEAVTMAKGLAAARKRKPSLREISEELAEAGHLNENGKPFAPKSVASMLGR